MLGSYFGLGDGTMVTFTTTSPSAAAPVATLGANPDFFKQQGQDTALPAVTLATTIQPTTTAAPGVNVAAIVAPIVVVAVLAAVAIVAVLLYRRKARNDAMRAGNEMQPNPSYGTAL
jgi:hypothetical protein